MAKFGTYRNDPRTITAKFDSTCAETGAVIRKGDKCVYYPSVRKVYHVDSKTAEVYRMEAYDLAVLGANY